MFETKHALITIFCTYYTWCVDGNCSFWITFGRCFYWFVFLKFIFRASSTLPSHKNEPVPYDRLQNLGNQPGTFRHRIDLLKVRKVSFSTLFKFPSLPPWFALFRSCPRSDFTNFSVFSDNEYVDELSILMFLKFVKIDLIYLSFYNVLILYSLVAFIF